MAGVGVGLAKLVVIASNLVFFLFGCGLVVLGALFLTSRFHQAYQDTLGESFQGYTIFSAILIAIGFIILLLSFMGCCGAYREHSCMLITFASMLTFLILAQVAIAIAAFVTRGAAIDTLEESALRSISHTSDSDPSIYRAWNETQIYFGCCGVRSSADWIVTEGSPFYEASGSAPRYPDHCCREYSVGCAARGRPPWPQGCLEKVLTQFERYGLAMGLVAFIVALIELLGVVLACCLIRASKETASAVR